MISLGLSNNYEAFLQRLGIKNDWKSQIILLLLAPSVTYSIWVVVASAFSPLRRYPGPFLARRLIPSCSLTRALKLSSMKMKCEERGGGVKKETERG